MTRASASPPGIAACGAAAGETPEAEFTGALLREQYRSLTRLGPYVHGIVILTALALFAGAAPTRSLLGGIVLPAALVAVSAFRLLTWFKARSRVELETLEVVRRRLRAASVLGPTLSFVFVVTTAISTWRDGVAEFALALAAVWVVAAVCAICLNVVAREASMIVVAATAPLVAAFLARGAQLTFLLAALIAIAAAFVIRVLGENFGMFAEIVRSRFVIAEQRRAAEEARRAAMTIALTDDLTGLPNRRCFQSLLADRIGRARESGEPFALGLIDLDGFKPVNDAHGHPVGDAILKQAADRLARAMDGRGSAARIGGDEFAILCDGIGARDEAIALGQDIQSLFAAPFAAGRLGIRLTCACGFAFFPSSAAEPGDLVHAADAALYRAKALGPGVAAADEEASAQAALSAAIEALRGAAEGMSRQSGARVDGAAPGPVAHPAFLSPREPPREGAVTRGG
jgi:diguanylate cyclase (GGDEF)-like protein